MNNLVERLNLAETALRPTPIFKAEAQAIAEAASRISQLEEENSELRASLIELLEPLERASAEMVALGKVADENAEAAFDRARQALGSKP